MLLALQLGGYTKSNLEVQKVLQARNTGSLEVETIGYLLLVVMELSKLSNRALCPLL